MKEIMEAWEEQALAGHKCGIEMIKEVFSEDASVQYGEEVSETIDEVQQQLS